MLYPQDSVSGHANIHFSQSQVLGRVVNIKTNDGGGGRRHAFIFDEAAKKAL
jgi:hypothetical protein